MSTYCLPVTMKLARLFGILKLDCCYIDRVPDEILCNIFKFLKSPQDFVNCYNTCKKWRSVIRIPSLQKEVRCKYLRINCTKSMHTLVFSCTYLSHQFTAHDTILLVGGNFQEARKFESIACSKDTKIPKCIHLHPSLGSYQRNRLLCHHPWISISLLYPRKASILLFFKSLNK